eukprot:Nitzschia sp. Nitz4//scaffold1_size375055//282622//283975//NITZ4_000308-RA/size375055-augustus-gene-0.724-mRNA-1//-1//CDS//3329541141//8291//frame0
MLLHSINSSQQDILPPRAETVLSTPFKITTREASIRKAKGISTPHHNDVLMGRGGKNNQHSGNETLRGFARQHSQAYSCASKKEKSDISRELVRLMRELEPAARFLKYDADTNKWEDVGDDVAREKTSQVLRDAAKSKKTFAMDGHEDMPLVDENPSSGHEESSPPPQDGYDRFYLSPAEHYPEVYSENHHFYGYSHGNVSSHYYATTAPRNPSVTPVSSSYDPRKKVRTSESPLASMNYQAPRVPHFSESASKGTYLSPRRTSRYHRPSPGYHSLYSSQSSTAYDSYPRSPASAVIPAHYAVHARGGARNEPWMADINAQLFDVRSPVAKHGGRGRDLYQEELVTDHSDHREGAISPFFYPVYDQL